MPFDLLSTLHLFVKTHKQSLIKLFVFSAVLTLSEVAYRYIDNVMALHGWGSAFIYWLLIVMVILFARSKALSIAMVIFMAAGMFIHSLHYAFYQGWMTSVEYLLVSGNTGEVLKAFHARPKVFIVPFIWSCIQTLIFITVYKCRRTTHLGFNVLFILLIIFSILRPVISPRHISDGLYPGGYMPLVRVQFFTTGAFLGRNLPEALLGKTIGEEYKMPAPTAVSEPKVKNIIWIQGESQNTTHMSVFGYHRDTTPFLAKMQKNGSNAVVKKAYAMGIYTAVALPSLFNAIEKPSGMKQILSGETNLFRLAKEQGYRTEFISAQAEEELNFMQQMGHWIDHYKNGDQIGQERHQDIVSDRRLLDEFDIDSLDKGNNFIVLHQRGSHLAYGKTGVDERDIKLYGAQEEITPQEEADERLRVDYLMASYDNTVHWTDSLISDVYKKLKARNIDDWILIYTSDHGDVVNGTFFGHGVFEPEVYEVPLFIYTPKKSLQKQIIASANECKIMPHYRLATEIIGLLGYKMPVADCHHAYVNGAILSGAAGYMAIDQQKSTKEMVLPQ